jgi:hypothetical protein
MIVQQLTSKSFITDPNSIFVRTVRVSLKNILGEEVNLEIKRSIANTNHVAVYGIL